MKRHRKLVRVLALAIACLLLAAGCSAPAATPAPAAATPAPAAPSPAPAAATPAPAAAVPAAPSPAPVTPAATPGNFNETGYPIVKDKITLTISGSRSNFCPAWKDLIMMKDIEEMFNIVLDCKEYSAEEWKVQKGLLFASGDLPDLFVGAGFSLSEAADYGAQGFLLPLNDLISKYGVNTKVVFGKNNEMERMCTSGDGNIYTLVEGSAIPANMANRNWINAKWIERVGKTYPKTLDELYDLSAAFKNEDANGNGDKTDELPISSRVLDEVVINALGMPIRGYNGMSMFINNGAPSLACTDERFKVYLEWMRKFYADGLLDSAAFIQTGEELNAKIAQGRVGAYTAPAPWLYEKPETAFDFVYFGGLTSAQNTKPTIGATTGLVASGRVAITTKNKLPAETFRLIDYFYSDEGSTFGFIGREDVGWKWDDKAKGTWNRVLPDGWTDSDEAYRNGKLILNGWNIYRDTEWKLFTPTGNNVWLYDKYTEGAVPYFTPVFPTVTLTADEQKRISTLSTDLDSYVGDAVARFVLGETDLGAGWDSFQKTLVDMGVGEVVKINTDAYNRFMGK